MPTQLQIASKTETTPLTRKANPKAGQRLGKGPSSRKNRVGWRAAPFQVSTKECQRLPSPSSHGAGASGGGGASGVGFGISSPPDPTHLVLVGKDEVCSQGP